MRFKSCIWEYLVNRNTDKTGVISMVNKDDGYTFGVWAWILLSLLVLWSSGKIWRGLLISGPNPRHRGPTGEEGSQGQLRSRDVNCGAVVPLLGECHCPLTSLQKLRPILRSPRVLEQTLPPLWPLACFLLRLWFLFCPLPWFSASEENPGAEQESTNAPSPSSSPVLAPHHSPGATSQQAKSKIKARTSGR